MQIMRLLANSVMTDNSTIGFIIVDSHSINLTLDGSLYPHRGLAPQSFHNNVLLLLLYYPIMTHN
jgi:hypothetical protein